MTYSGIRNGFLLGYSSSKLDRYASLRVADISLVEEFVLPGKNRQEASYVTSSSGLQHIWVMASYDEVMACIWKELGY